MFWGDTTREARPRRSEFTLRDGLIQRGVDVLRLIAAGKTYREIAEEVIISFRTVGIHLRSILNRTSAANRAEAAA